MDSGMQSIGRPHLLREAVDAVVNSFRKHSDQEEDVDVVEALEEFWLMKQAREMHKDNASITYSFMPDTGPPFICYVTLPGGSCFGSFEVCESKRQAKQSCAKIALMNSVFNEHPFSIINAGTASKIISDARASFCSRSIHSNSALTTLKNMLETHTDRNVLAFQEKMSIFQLLHWNGSLKMMKSSGCTREEVIEHYSNRNIDNDLITQFADDWVYKEKEQTGIIKQELNKASLELYASRTAGHELRFFIEKVHILSIALDLFQPNPDVVEVA